MNLLMSCVFGTFIRWSLQLQNSIVSDHALFLEGRAALVRAAVRFIRKIDAKADRNS
jgi:hypothetical protein